eukprot:349951-Chlamydomonas_euryale.AAC.3
MPGVDAGGRAFSPLLLCLARERRQDCWDRCGCLNAAQKLRDVAACCSRRDGGKPTQLRQRRGNAANPDSLARGECAGVPQAHWRRAAVSLARPADDLLQRVER